MPSTATASPRLAEATCEAPPSLVGSLDGPIRMLEAAEMGHASLAISSIFFMVESAFVCRQIVASSLFAVAERPVLARSPIVDQACRAVALLVGPTMAKRMVCVAIFTTSLV